MKGHPNYSANNINEHKIKGQNENKVPIPKSKTRINISNG